jgi:hypothetical protein
LAGAALLFTPDAGAGAIDHKLVIGFLLLQFGMAGWSFGSIIQRRKAGKAHPVIAGGVQQIAAGLAMIPVALMSGNLTVHWSTRGVGDRLLITTDAGGYSAFAMRWTSCRWRSCRSPVRERRVAVALGWLFYRGRLAGGKRGRWSSSRRVAVKRYSQAPVARSTAAGRQLGPEGAPAMLNRVINTNSITRNWATAGALCSVLNISCTPVDRSLTSAGAASPRRRRSTPWMR